jgi:hypothetical protein
MKGQCLCGEVAFELREPIPAVYQCHCSLCRKQSGTYSNLAMAVNSRQFSWLSGQACVTTYKRPTGFTSSFCSQCGSPVPNLIGRSDIMWIPVGLLETDALLNVKAHIFINSKSTSEAMPSSGQCYDTMPPLDELVAFLHA